MYDRLPADAAAIPFVDHQTGLALGVRDLSVPEFVAGVTALATLAKPFDRPCAITTSAAEGPNEPALPPLGELLPTAAVIARPGEIDAWDDEAFVEAMRGGGRRRPIVAGLPTEAGVAFVAAATHPVKSSQ